MAAVVEPLTRATDAVRDLPRPVRSGLVAGAALVGPVVATLVVESWETPHVVSLVLGAVGAFFAILFAEEEEGALAWVASAGKGLFAFMLTYQAVYAVWQITVGLVIFGVAIGLLYGLLAVGIVLIYRTNRIINFAAGAMGTVPGVFFGLAITKGLSYWIALPGALIGGVLFGAGFDVLIIRRFSDAPRLILTVVTIGISQLCVFLSLQVPNLLGIDSLPSRILTPLTGFERRFGGSNITGDYWFAAFVSILMVSLLIAFFRYTRMGIAVRASAENADRALMLGIPVARVEMIAWGIAGLFASATIFLRTPIVGPPIAGLSSLNVILFALTAATVAKMDKLGVAMFTGVAIGIIDQGSVFGTGRGSVAATLMLPIILIALLAQSGVVSRAFDTGVSSFRSVREVRPIPPELRHLPELRNAKIVIAILVLAFFASAPAWMGDSLGRGTLVVIFAIVGVSLVVLTGWAGQISLGQFAFTGIGATVAGGYAANNNIDIFVALLIGGLAGAVAAVIVGVPALRVQGLFLAVTTLAFAVATEFYLLSDDSFFGKWFLPDEGNTIEAPVLWGRFRLDPFQNTRNYYYFCVAILFLMIGAATAFRKNRAGRVIIAVRDNGRAAASLGINNARTKLAAFAVSGFIAAIAGVLFAYQSGSISAGTYGAAFSLQAFIVTVIGGIGTVPGAVIGAIVIQGVDFAASKQTAVESLDLIVTAPGLMLVLYFLPGGFAQLFYDRRDQWLRRLAARHQIHVPSLVADSLVDEDSKTAEENLLVGAAASAASTELSEVGHTDYGEQAITCPVCGVGLSLEEAAGHDHLKATPAETAGSPS